MSPADRWGLLGLLAMIKSADLDTNLLSVGTDLGTMGLDMQTPGYGLPSLNACIDSPADGLEVCTQRSSLHGQTHPRRIQ